MSDPYWSNVVLAMHMDGANNSTTFTDLKGKTVTPYGNAQISTTQSKFGGSSAYFDGSGDYLSVPNSSNFNFGISDFTIEMHIKSIGGAAGFLTQRTTPTQNGIFIQTSGSNIDCYLGGGGATWFAHVGGLVSNISEWNHMALIRNNTTLNLFINGTLASQQTGVTQSITSGLPVIIGADVGNASYFNGYIDDLRITKDMARYTSNFTPPTQAFPNSGVATNSSSMFLVF